MAFLQEIDVFDIYHDDTLPQNKKSVAIRLTFQNDVKTLNEQEISDAMNKILALWASRAEHLQYYHWMKRCGNVLQAASEGTQVFQIIRIFGNTPDARDE